MSNTDTGAARIMRERERQIVEEGHSDAHDDEVNNDGQLLAAAVAYAELAQQQVRLSDVDEVYEVPSSWPWDDEFWKPSEDPLRNLEKAGALIAAQMDYILRGRAWHEKGV